MPLFGWGDTVDLRIVGKLYLGIISELPVIQAKSALDTEYRYSIGSTFSTGRSS
jgi:hypothetical protein